MGNLPLAMSVGIEADDNERTLDMAFRAVGDLAVEVLRNAGIATGQPGEEGPASPSIASTAGGQTGGNGKGKRPSNGGDRARPVQEGNNVMQSGGTVLLRNDHANAHRMVYVLPFSRCERIANPRPGAISPVAAMRSHLLKEWLKPHQWTSPRWGMR